MFGFDMINVIKTSELKIKLSQKDKKTDEVMNTYNFLKKCSYIYKNNLMNSYGMYCQKEDKERNIEAKYMLCCLSPKVCFDKIMSEKPYKLLFTSGTLP